MKPQVATATILFLSSLAFSFNHPELKWQSVTTAHFIIHYYDRTEPAVYATWKIAEESYASLSDLYDFSEHDKINIALADYDDYANGSTDWTNGSIIIWITDARFDLRGNTTWLRNVITHELSHVVTLETKSKMQLFDWTFAFDYTSPRVGISLAEPFATTRFWPSWLTEGAAQLESTRRGNDCWDSRRDMLLSDAVATGRQFSLDEMGYFNHTSLGNELVYNQGFAFFKFIEAKIGTPAMVRVWNEARNSSLVMNDFRSYFADQTGQRLEDLYRLWIDSVKVAAHAREPVSPTQTVPIWAKGIYNHVPKVSANGKWWGWLTSSGDEFDRTDLVIAPNGTHKPIYVVQWALSSWDFSPDSKRVYFLKARELSDNGSAFNDLYDLDIANGHLRRLTRNGRLYDVAVCPGKSRVACVQFANGAYSIVVAGLDGRDQTTLAAGILGQPFVGLSFSPTTISLPPVLPATPAKDSVAPALADTSAKPDSTKKDSVLSLPKPAKALPAAEPLEYKIVTSRLINGRGRICIIGVSSGKVRIVGPDFGQQEFPHWGKDGRIYFDADFDGIFNIYSMLPDGTDLRRHTSVAGGMFEPFFDNSGKLLCAQFSRQAFSIVACDPGAGVAYAMPQSYACSFSDDPRPKGEIIIKNRPYEAKLLRPIWELQSVLSVTDQTGTVLDAIYNNRFGAWSDTAPMVFGTAIEMSRTDALDKQEVALGVMAGIAHQGIAVPDSSINGNTVAMRSGLRSPLLSQNDRFASFTDQKLREASGAPLRHDAGISRRALSFIHSTSLAKATATQSDSSQSSSSSSSGPATSWAPVLYPSFGIQNSMTAVTLTANVQAAIAYGLPAEIAASGEASWQASRDWYFGAAPEIDIYTFEFPLSEVKIPLYAMWFTYGYENVDISYNMAGVSQAELSVTPDFFGSVDSIDPNTVRYPRFTATTAELQFLHGFPLTMHSSFVFTSDDYYTHLSADNFLDPRGLLKGLSSEYMNLSANGAFVFPLWRQINGGPAYADALYGQFGYGLLFYTNKPFGYTGADYAKALSTLNVSDPSIHNHMYVSHVVTAGLKLGFYKSYEFARLLSAAVSWDILRNNVAASFSVGF
jgi:hypothetical protein